MAFFIPTARWICLLVALTSFGQRKAGAFSPSPSGVQLEFSVDEEQPAATLVGSVVKRNSSDDVVEGRRFGFRHPSTSPPYEYFTIDDVTGDIRTSERLDRETICPSSLSSAGRRLALATSVATGASSACRVVLDVKVQPAKYFQIIRVVVEIRDVNDNSPQFPEPRLTLRIPESVAVGATFPLPLAVDQDTNQYGVRDYYLSTSSDVFELDTVYGKSDSAASTSKSSGHKQQGLDDGKSPGVGDGSSERVFEAVRLRLKTPLDRETSAHHRLTVVAVDGGNPALSGSVDVEIAVQDVNDNAPKFDRAVYEAEVSENRKTSRSTSIIRLRASDLDEGNNGAVVYSLVRSAADRGHNASLLFRVDPESGDLFAVRSLDRERDGGTVQMTVVASDRGTNPLSSFARITVVIRDENDNAPEVVVTAASKTVSESSQQALQSQPEIVEHSPPGTFIAHVVATDRDEGPNGSVECWTDGRQFRLEPVALKKSAAEVESSETDAGLEVVIPGDSDDARQNARYMRRRRNRQNQLGASANWDGTTGGRVEYQLRSVLSFDREDADQVLATVYCRDAGLPPLLVAKDVVVRVLDVNDHAPEIDGAPRLTVDVAERNEVGVELIRVRATDRDEGENGRLEYDLKPIIQPGADADFIPAAGVSIDRFTGIVTADISFDYETRTSYEFLVTVTDGVPASGTRTSPAARHRGIASSARMSATATLAIRIRDTDDERPHFDRASYHFTIRENVSPGTSVGRVTATDADISPRFNRVVYHIENDHPESVSRIPFDVDRRTGQITTSGRIDRETTPVYRFAVVATNDAPTTPTTSGQVAVKDATVSVAVYVEDENDNAPIVRFPSQLNNVVWLFPDHQPHCFASGDNSQSEFKSGDCLITRIDAVDPDDGENARLTYQLNSATGNRDSNSSQSSSLFAVDPQTGVVVSTGPLALPSVADRHGMAYRIVITVRDAGEPSNMAVADLTVRVNATAVPIPPAVVQYAVDQRSASKGFVAVADGDRSEINVDSSSNSISGSSSSSTASVMSDEKVIIVVGMVCGVVVIVLIVSTICCFVFLRRRSQRNIKAKADDGRRQLETRNGQEYSGFIPSQNGGSVVKIGRAASSTVTADGGSSRLLSKSRDSKMADEATSCALGDDDDWRLDIADSEEQDKAKYETRLADRKYRRMLGDFGVTESRTSSMSHCYALPDMIVSHASILNPAASVATTAEAAANGDMSVDSGTACSHYNQPAADFDHGHHHHHHHYQGNLMHPHHLRRQSKAASMTGSCLLGGVSKRPTSLLSACSTQCCATCYCSCCGHAGVCGSSTRLGGVGPSSYYRSVVSAAGSDTWNGSSSTSSRDSLDDSGGLRSPSGEGPMSTDPMTSAVDDDADREELSDVVEITARHVSPGSDSEYSANGELSSQSSCMDSGMAPSECGSNCRRHRHSHHHHNHHHHHHHQEQQPTSSRDYRHSYHHNHRGHRQANRRSSSTERRHHRNHRSRSRTAVASSAASITKRPTELPQTSKSGTPMTLDVDNQPVEKNSNGSKENDKLTPAEFCAAIQSVTRDSGSQNTITADRNSLVA